MFNLTYEERRVILFLAGLALTGLLISFFIKMHPCPAGVTRIDTDSRIAKVDINRADYKDLRELLGLAPGLAEKIIAYRSACGRFKNLEELKEINGIGDFRYEKLKDLFFVQP